MKKVILILLVCFSISCKDRKSKNFISYSTQSDSTLHYYRQGWVQIMDEGNYTAAENSYRKALTFDPDFLIGQSVLARLTLDATERLKIYKIIENQRNKMNGNERKILDVYAALLHHSILRDQKSPDSKQAFQAALQLAENNLRQIVHQYPQETYLKAEYMEVLRYTHSSKEALDSLQKLILPSQSQNPFLIGFEATLEADLGNYDRALSKANELKILLDESKAPKINATFAAIYFKKGEIEKAKMYVEKALQIDPKNVDAKKLKREID